MSASPGVSYAERYQVHKTINVFSSFRIKIKKFYVDVQSKGVVAELRTPIYVTFVIAVATALTVRMIFAIDTVMMTTAAVTRIRICWKRQVIN